MSDKKNSIIGDVIDDVMRPTPLPSGSSVHKNIKVVDIKKSTETARGYSKGYSDRLAYLSVTQVIHASYMLAV